MLLDIDQRSAFQYEELYLWYMNFKEVLLYIFRLHVLKCQEHETSKIWHMSKICSYEKIELLNLTVTGGPDYDMNENLLKVVVNYIHSID